MRDSYSALENLEGLHSANASERFSGFGKAGAEQPLRLFSWLADGRVLSAELQQAQCRLRGKLVAQRWGTPLAYRQKPSIARRFTGTSEMALPVRRDSTPGQKLCIVRAWFSLAPATHPTFVCVI